MPKVGSFTDGIFWKMYILISSLNNLYKKEHWLLKAQIIPSLYRKECGNLILFNHLLN